MERNREKREAIHKYTIHKYTYTCIHIKYTFKNEINKTFKKKSKKNKLLEERIEKRLFIFNSIFSIQYFQF